MKVSIWMTYDLGVGGDYQGLYAWLDDHEAIECGDGTAYIKYDVPDSVTSDKDLVACLQKDIKERVDIPQNDTKYRIYIVRKSLEKDKKNRPVGSFVIGRRKANPWVGFGTKNVKNAPDE
jgi:hypothetical protein